MGNLAACTTQQADDDAVLAIRAEIPLAVLRDTIAQFPTYSESYVSALRTLPGRTASGRR